MPLPIIGAAAAVVASAVLAAATAALTITKEVISSIKDGVEFLLKVFDVLPGVLKPFAYIFVLSAVIYIFGFFVHTYNLIAPGPDIPNCMYMGNETQNRTLMFITASGRDDSKKEDTLFYQVVDGVPADDLQTRMLFYFYPECLECIRDPLNLTECSTSKNLSMSSNLSFLQGVYSKPPIYNYEEGSCDYERVQGDVFTLYKNYVDCKNKGLTVTATGMASIDLGPGTRDDTCIQELVDRSKLRLEELGRDASLVSSILGVYNPNTPCPGISLFDGSRWFVISSLLYIAVLSVKLNWGVLTSMMDKYT